MTDPVVFEPTPVALEAAQRALSRGFCPECFGRMFGRLGHGLTNPERTRRLLEPISATLPALAAPCAVCGDIFARMEVWVERGVRSVDGFEWHRFTCGSRWEPETLAREENLWLQLGTEWGESARSAFNREWGKALEARTGASGGPDRPDVVFLADLAVGRVEPTLLPLYVRGRYRKLDRTIPQTHWPCRRCRGRGCDSCGGSGKTYPTSVEELVGAPLLAAAGARETRFHGMGREDIDARMLGRGRPFVLELVQPRRRALDLTVLGPEIARSSGGRVEVDGLRMAEATDVVHVKEAAPEKSYRVGVVGVVPVAKVNEALDVATGRAIAQRTPTRVAHRRSDRVRARRIVSARVTETAEAGFTLEIRTEAGTYVKEWVEGDGGRTEPNLAGLVGIPLKVGFLDVLDVHDSEG
ncbi:MAG: tRNA pseudouridine(54/55) synthase Pus10 [Thermoplasmata archaeon]|nr:tRNA pseudouridine(54/55) synthase Pus10 [Thermoplasmata archaeon]